jgi:hypothetical protein
MPVTGCIEFFNMVRADASRVRSTFTLLDAAHRGVILSKVQNHFNCIRFGSERIKEGMKEFPFLFLALAHF